MPPLDLGAARTEREALRAYLDALRRTIAAFAENVVLYRSALDSPSSAYVLRVAGPEAVPLVGAGGEARLRLLLELRFRPVSVRRGRWAVHTLGYVYELREAGHPVRPIVAYHWHPHVPRIGFPHIHLHADDSDLRRLHVAAPHCTLLHPLAVAVRDFGVRPIRDDWRRLLDEGDGVLRASVAWSEPVSFLGTAE